jgi:hypothetical protein
MVPERSACAVPLTTKTRGNFMVHRQSQIA